MLRRALPLLLLLACASGPPPVPTAPRELPPAPAPVEFPPPVPIESCSDTGEGFDDWLAAVRARAVAEGLTPEARFGVAPEIVVALWGLETDFGAYQGRNRSLAALATLAYDCRRAERFRSELASALRIVQRGHLVPAEMVGAWAGELGQTQFLASSNERFGVDFDEDGRIDLVGSVPDALASTASYLAGNGWEAHAGYGPGSANLVALESWNESEVYRRTVVLFATKLTARAGAAPPAPRSR